MLSNQARISTKDNSKLLSIKIINNYKKKNLGITDNFLGVIKESKNLTLKVGKLNDFVISSLRKETLYFSGKWKKSDHNSCLAIKNKQTLEPIGTRFHGVFYSELRYKKNKKLKNLINKCI